MTKEQEAILNLMRACNSLMGEVTRKSPADWMLVNDAMLAGRWLLPMGVKVEL